MEDKFCEKIWQYIRIMKYFSFFDLQILLTLDNKEYNIEDLESYLQTLNNCKIIKKLKNDSYFLDKNLGYYAPLMLSDSLIYDPNSDKNILFSENFIYKFDTKYVHSKRGGKNGKNIY